MAVIKFIKATEIPATWLPDALYFIKTNGYAETWVTSSDGTPEEVGNSQMIEEVAEGLGVSRFGIEDNTSDQNRAMDMQQHDFKVEKAANIHFYSFSPGATTDEDLYFGIQMAPDHVELFADEGYTPTGTTTILRLITTDATLTRPGKAESPIVTQSEVVKNVPNGYAGLDANGLVPSALLPIPANVKGSVGVDLDGRGVVLTTGQKGYVRVPYNGTITDWSIIADISGSCVFDVWKKNNAYPTVADTITAAAKPTLTNGTLATGSSLTGWNAAVTSGDIFGWNLDSVTSVTGAILQLTILKS